MACYGALVSLSQTIQHILQHDDEQSSSAFLHEKQQIRSLCEGLIFLRDSLDENSPDKLANGLEGRIRDITYKAENVVEHFMSQHFRSHFDSKPRDNSSHHDPMHKDLELYSYAFKQLCQELEMVTGEISTVVGEVMEMKKKNSLIRTEAGDDAFTKKNTSSLSSPRPMELSPINTTTTEKAGTAMVGFKENLLAINKRLCGGLSALQIIPIFGMGGIGKTTLAINAYNDPLIVETFEIRVWVTVSQEYSVKEIISELLLALKPFIKETDQSSTSLKRERTLQEEALIVFQTLKGRRYLIVLDDMWSTNVWDEVRRLFPSDDDNGSRIMLTTRLSDVAEYPTDSSSPSYELHCLNADQSWDMLRQKVLFKHEDHESCLPSELEDIGKMIASSCRGLPLAIVVVAGILSTISQTRASWNIVAQSVTSAVSTNNEHFAKILSLSYANLPYHLRPCFLYMGGFPEDYEIKVSKLIKLWVAEGFLKLINIEESLLRWEEVAEEYLEDLVKRSLVLATKRKTNGRIKSCSLHDLLRDMCIKTAQEEKFLLNITPKNIISKGIHKNDTNIRTILCFTYWGSGVLTILKHFRSLRVLDFETLVFSTFPVEVFELFLLRYLAFSVGPGSIIIVPPSISKLQNLQALLIFSKSTVGPDGMYDLTREIWRMTQLRHLVLPEGFIWRLPPHPNTFTLENLQTLLGVKNFYCSIKILQCIPNLRKLQAIYSEVISSSLKNLVHLNQLENLSLEHEGGTSYSGPLSRRICFPKTLRQLKLIGFSFIMEDMKMIGSLQNVQVLKLRKCSYEGGKWETAEDGFPELKFLQIIGTNLENWITDYSHFPCLERLMISGCRNLEKIPDVIGEIPTLEQIEVDKDDNSLVESAKWIKEEQQSYGNDSIQVRLMN